MKDLYPYLMGVLVGALLMVFIVGGVSSIEDRSIAEKCDFAGKVKLGDHAYACERITEAASRTTGATP
jgi:hypothetical protein